MGRNEQEMSPLDVAREEQEGEVVRILEEWIVEHEQLLHWSALREKRLFFLREITRFITRRILSQYGKTIQ